jgi:hypothetical protein
VDKYKFINYPLLPLLQTLSIEKKIIVMIHYYNAMTFYFDQMEMGGWPN